MCEGRGVGDGPEDSGEEAWVEAELDRELAAIDCSGLAPLPSRDLEYPVVVWDDDGSRAPPPAVLAVAAGRSGALELYGGPAPSELRPAPRQRPRPSQAPPSRPATPPTPPRARTPVGNDGRWASCVEAFERMMKESAEQTAMLAGDVAELRCIAEESDTLLAAVHPARPQPSSPPPAPRPPSSPAGSELHLSDFSDEGERALIAECPEVLDHLRTQWAAEDEQTAREEAQQKAAREALVEEEFRARVVAPQLHLDCIRIHAERLREAAAEAAHAAPPPASPPPPLPDVPMEAPPDAGEEQVRQARAERDRRAAERVRQMAEAAAEAERRERDAERREEEERARAEAVAREAEAALERQRAARAERRAEEEALRQREDAAERQRAADLQAESVRELRRAAAGAWRAARERQERARMGAADGDSSRAERHRAEEARRLRRMAEAERALHFEREKAKLAAEEPPRRRALLSNQESDAAGLRGLGQRLLSAAAEWSSARTAVLRQQSAARDAAASEEQRARQSLSEAERRHAGACASFTAAVADLEASEAVARSAGEHAEWRGRAAVEELATALRAESETAAAAAAAARVLRAAAARRPLPPQPPPLLRHADRAAQLRQQSAQRAAWQSWAEATELRNTPRRDPTRSRLLQPRRAQQEPRPGAEEDGCSTETEGPRGGVFTERTAEALTGVSAHRLVRVAAPLEALSSVAPPLGRLRRLAALDLSGNKIAQVRGLGETPGLEFLGLRDNALASLDCLQEGPGAALRVLDVSDNRLGSLDGISGVPGLRRLLAGGNCVRQLPDRAQLPPALAHLDLYRNNVSDLSPLAGLSTLTSLNVGRNAVTDISSLSSGLPLLRSVYLDANRIRSIPSRIDAVMLRQLWLGGNCIDRIPDLAHCPLLSLLDVHENHITDVGGVSGCLHLEFLNAAFNRLDSGDRLVAALAPLQRLHTLAVNDNPVWEHGGSAAGQGPPRLRRDLVAALPALRELNSDGLEEAERAAAERECLPPIAHHRLLRMCLGGGGTPDLAALPPAHTGGADAQQRMRWGRVLAPAPWAHEERAELWALSSYDWMCRSQLDEQHALDAAHRLESDAAERRRRQADDKGVQGLHRRNGGALSGGVADASQQSAGALAARQLQEVTDQLSTHALAHAAPGVGHAQHVWRACTKYQQRREQHRRAAAAQRLTTWARRVVARQQLRRMRAQRLAAAARRIQPLWRGAVVRQRLARGMWFDDDPEHYGEVDANFADAALSAASAAPLPGAAMLLAERLMRSGVPPPQPPPVARNPGAAPRPTPAGAASERAAPPAAAPAAAPSPQPPPPCGAWEGDSGADGATDPGSSLPADDINATWAQGMARRDKKFELIRKRRQKAERAAGLLRGSVTMEARVRDLQNKVQQHHAAPAGGHAAGRPRQQSCATPARRGSDPALCTPQRAATFSHGHVVEGDIEVRSLGSTGASAASAAALQGLRRTPTPGSRLPPLGR